MSITIQADEHIKKAISDGIKRRGVELYTVEEEKIKGESDEDLLQFAEKENRVILTNDSDFLEVDLHPGILYITSQYAPIGDVVREVVRHVDQYTKEEFQDTIFYIP